MLKVSRARVYLSKLASVARVVKMARAMEKAAEGVPKPQGLDGNVGINKGVDVTAPLGSGGATQDTTSRGVSNMAVGPVGKGSPLNAGKPFSGDAQQPAGAGFVNTANQMAGNVYGTQVSSNGPTSRVGTQRQPTRANVQEPLYVPSMEGLSREEIDQWESRIRQAYKNGQKVISEGQAWGRWTPDQLDPQRVKYWSEHGSLPRYNGAGLQILPGGTVRSPGLGRNSNLATSNTLQAGQNEDLRRMVSSMQVRGFSSNTPGIKEGWQGFYEPGTNWINVNVAGDTPFVRLHEWGHKVNGDMVSAQQPSKMAPASSFEETELPAMMNEFNAAITHGDVDPSNPVYYMPYLDRIFGSRFGTGMAGAQSAYGTDRYGTMPANPNNVKTFIPVTPLRSMVLGDGTETTGNSLGEFAAPFTYDAKNNKYIPHPTLQNWARNMGQAQTAYNQALANPGVFFATLEDLQNVTAPMFAFSHIPMPSKGDYSAITRAPLTVQEFVKAQNDPSQREVVSRMAPYMRNDMTTSMYGNGGPEANPSYQAVLNATPEEITPAMVQSQVDRAVTPGMNSRTDIRDMETMGEMHDDHAEGWYYQYVLPQYLGGPMPDVMPRYTFNQLRAMNKEYWDMNRGHVKTVAERDEDAKRLQKLIRNAKPLPKGETQALPAPEEPELTDEQQAFDEEERRIAEENANGNHQMRARWVDPKTVPPHEREIPSFMRGISSSETPVTNAPSVDPPIASPEVAQDVVGVDSVNYDDSISFGHPAGAENYYRPDEDVSSTSGVTGWTDYGEDDLSNLGSRFVDNSGSDVLDSNPYDPQAEQEYDPDQIYRDFGVDPNNRQPDGSLLPPLRLGQQEYDPDQIYRDFGVDPNNRQPDGSLLPPLVLNNPATNTDEWTYSDTGSTSSITRARKELGGYRGSDDWDDDIDSQFNDLNNQMESFGGDIVSGQDSEEDETMPGWTPEGLGEQNDFPALHQRDYRGTGAGSWMTTEGDKTKPSIESPVAPTDSSREPAVAQQAAPPTTPPSAPPVRSTPGTSEQRTYDSGDQQYTKQELDELIQNNDWRDQLDVLNGSALAYALEQGIGNSFDENWDTDPQTAVDYFKAGILSYAQREGKITDEQAEYLSNAADAYLERRRGGASSRGSRSASPSASAPTTPSTASSPSVPAPASSSPAPDPEPTPAPASSPSAPAITAPAATSSRPLSAPRNSGDGQATSSPVPSASDGASQTYQSGDMSYTKEELDKFISERSPEEQYNALQGDALVYAMSQRLPIECKKSYVKNRPPKDALSMYAQGPLAQAVMDGKITTAQAADLFNAFYEQLWQIKPDSMLSYEKANGIQTTDEHMTVLSNAKRAREEYADERARERNSELYMNSPLAYNPMTQAPAGMPGYSNNDPRYNGTGSNRRRRPPKSAY